MGHKYGRLAPHPEHTHPRLKLSLHLATVPTPPATVDWHSKVKSFPMYLNDEIGDCTEASNGHMIQVSSTYGQGRTISVSDQAILTAYERVSGYDPDTGENDNGAVIQDELGDWRKHGIDGHQCTAFGQLNDRDLDEVRKAVWLFGNANLGIVVYESMENDFDIGRPWTRVSGQQLGGHCVPVVGYDTDHVYVVTWGKVQPMTWNCYRAVTEEAWGVLLPEWFNTAGVDPTGLDMKGLGEDFTSLTGEPNPFHDDPPKPPVPVPPVAPTAADVAAAVRKALDEQGV